MQYIELYNSEETVQEFRCYAEENVTGQDKVLGDMIIDTYGDDDCQTDEEQLKAATKDIIEEVDWSYNNYKC